MPSIRGAHLFLLLALVLPFLSIHLAADETPRQADQPTEGKTTLTGHILGLTTEELPRVQVNAHSWARPEKPRLTEANRDGSYRIEGLGPGDWDVEAWSPSSGQLWSGTVQIPAGASEAALDLGLPKGLAVTGRVLMDGKPLSGGSVEARGGNTNSAQTAYDGTFTLQGLSGGPLILVIKNSNGFAGIRTFPLTEDRKVSIELSTGRLRGRVATVAGEPVDDAAVSVDAWIPEIRSTVSAPGAQTGADGGFEIPGLAAGTYKVKISKKGFAPVETTVEVPPGAGGPPMEILLTPREETR
jgi:hypothetical protein